MLKDIFMANGTVYVQGQDNRMYTPNLETGRFEYPEFCETTDELKFCNSGTYDFLNDPPETFRKIFGGSAVFPSEFNDVYYVHRTGIYYQNYIGLDKPEDPVKVVDYASTGLGISTSMVRTIISPTMILIESANVLDMRSLGYSAKPAFLFYDIEKAAEEKKSLELLYIGGMGSYINNAIAYFNMTNGEYRIDLVDYAQYKTDDNPNGAIDKMELDFANGDYPDLIFINDDMDITNYTRKGMLMNLYDLGFDASKLLGGVRTVSEFAGGLYRLPLTFRYSALMNRDGIEKLTPDDLYSLYAEHGNDLFPQLTRDMLIDSLTNAGIYNAYIDYDGAVCDFDNAEFVKYLEFLRSYNNVPREGLEPILGNTVGKEHLQLVKGHESLFYVADTKIVDGLLGIYNFMYEDTGYTFCGFPTTEASGIVIKPSNEFAVTTACAYPEAALEFLNLLFDSAEADEYLWTTSLHTNREILTARLDRTYGEEFTVFLWLNSGSANSYKTAETPEEYFSDPNSQALDMTDAEVEHFIEAVLDAEVARPVDDEVLRIISDELTPFLAGQDSAANVAHRIDSRVGIYLAERYS
nr:extracellular solute-binding protein [Clostridia bacterium]